MILGPQAIGVSMDMFGVHGFGWALAVFFGGYMVLSLGRIAAKVGGRRSEA